MSPLHCWPGMLGTYKFHLPIFLFLNWESIPEFIFWRDCVLLWHCLLWISLNCAGGLKGVFLMYHPSALNKHRSLWFFSLWRSMYCSQVEYNSDVWIVVSWKKIGQDLAGKDGYLESRNKKASGEWKGGNWGRRSPWTKEETPNHDAYLSLMLAELYKLYRKLCTAGDLLSVETLNPGPVVSGSGGCPGGSERSYDTCWKTRTWSQCCG